MLQLFYGGCEINAFGELLESMGVDTVTVSFMGLRRRIKHLDKVNLADRFGDGTKILLDSGCHTINSAPDRQYSDEELKEIAAEYYAFVERNEERIHAYTEFDALQLGAEWIHERRWGFPKEIVVWHEEDGLDALAEMGETWPNIGVTGTSLGDRDLTPLLNRITREHGTQLYGLGMTKPEQMAEISWTGVTSTSWLSPVKFRDIIVWTGNELKRYPKKNRDSGKRRHRTLFQRIGINPDLIEADDNNELLRLSIWSWMQQVAKINGTSVPDQVAANSAGGPLSDFAEMGGTEVDTRAPLVQNENPLGNAPRKRSKRPIPGMTVEEREVEEHGKKRTLKLISAQPGAYMECTGCHLAGKCPEFDPGAECAFEIPAIGTSEEELEGALEFVAQTQLQRFSRAAMAERQDGGYVDANTSRELKLFMDVIKMIRDSRQESFSLTIKAKQQSASTAAGAGVLSRIFGREPVEQQQRAELPAAVPQKSAMEQMGISDVQDAEIVEEQVDAS